MTSSTYQGMTLSSSHEESWKKERNLGKEKQQECTGNEAQEKGENALVYEAKGQPRNVPYNKDADGNRWDDYAHHDRNADHDAEPYGVIAQFNNCRIKDRGGKNHKSKVINKGAADQIDQDNKYHNHPARKGKPCNPVSGDERDLRNSKEVAQHNGPGNKEKGHHCSS